MKEIIKKITAKVIELDIKTRVKKLHKNIKIIMKAIIKKITAKVIELDIKTRVKNLRKDILKRKRKKRRRKNTGTDSRPEFILYKKPKSPVAESYRMIRTNIQFSDAAKRLKSIVVTSAGPREGKTTTVVNLGCAFAQANKKTLIIDTDLRNVSFHKLFNLNNTVGLTSVILGQKRIDEVVYKDVLMPNLDVMTSGPKITNPAEIIGSRSVADFMDRMRSAYDMLIFDSPPVLAVTDAKLLSRNVDGVILVVQSSKVSREVARKARESLNEVNANIIGAILNDLDTSKTNYYYYHRYYYSYYAKEAKKGKRLEEKRPPEVTVEQKLEPEIKEKPAHPAKKKDLFIPHSSDSEASAKSPKSDGNIITMLSDKEKKETTEIDKSIDKSSPLGRKTAFFKETDRSVKEKKPDKRYKGKSGLGKKDIFKDI